ncbi:MAG TPA: maltose acetyltransferase domain-containing protein [Gaiellaceae bacterium]|nr:maltose acetyltransferase domain-containing protein [Gaiellaceae bacterium]
MSSERERMLAGELYDPANAELTALRHRARELLAGCRPLRDLAAV